MNKQEIETRQHEIETRIAELEKDMYNFELDPDDYRESYHDMLNFEGPIHVCGFEFSASDIIKEMDPIAYRCGFNDYMDMLDKDGEKENAPEYMEMVEELEELQIELEDLETELSELEENEGK